MGRDRSARAAVVLGAVGLLAGSGSCFFSLAELQSADAGSDASLGGTSGSQATGGSWSGGTGGAPGGGGSAGAAGGAATGGVTGGGGSVGGGGTGACGGKDCLGGACVSNKCQPVLLASDQTEPKLVAPYDVAVDATTVYFTVKEYTMGAGYVMSVPIGGGQPKVLAQGQDFPHHITLDATHVYWTNTGESAPSAGSVARVPKAGGTVQVLSTGQTNAVGVCVDDANAYFSTHTASGAVRSVPKGGGSITNLATGQGSPYQTVCDPGTSGDVYFSNGGDGVVKRVSKSGGAVTNVSEYQDSMRPLAMNGNELFFGRFAEPGMIQSVPKSGGTNKDLVTGIASIVGIAVDASHVYFTTYKSTSSPHANEVARAPRAGGPIEVLATGLKSAAGIAVDAKAVYWVDYGAFEIWKLAK